MMPWKTLCHLGWAVCPGQNHLVLKYRSEHVITVMFVVVSCPSVFYMLSSDMFCLMLNVFFLLITPHSPMARKTLWRPRWKRTSLHPASYMPQLHRQRATIHRQAKGQFITNGAQRGAQGSFQISLGFHIPVLGFFRRCRMSWKVTRLPCLSCDGIWRWNYVPGSYVGSIGFKSKAEGMIRLARKPWDHLLLCWRRWKLNP